MVSLWWGHSAGLFGLTRGCKSRDATRYAAVLYILVLLIVMDKLVFQLQYKDGG